MDGLALQRWIQQGKPASGSWEEVFGEGMEVDEIFMSWFYARYLDQVAAAGKAVYPLPMFANAWLISPGESHPGDYPSGGPIARELVVWQIGAPHLDLLAPDIYLEDFKQVTSRYHRGGNPLAIPEATGDVWFPLDSFRQFESARNVFWAIAEHDALVFAPFGIEGMSLEDPLFRSYKILGPILPELAAYQGTDRLRGILETRNDSGGTTIRFDRYEFSILFNQKRRPEDVAYGLLLQLDDNSFLVVGEGMTITVDATEGDYQDAALARVLEVRYDDGDWIPVRQLNGDETAQHKRIQVPPTTWDSFDDAPGPRMLMVDLFLRKQDVTEAQNSLQQISPSQQD